MRVKIKSWEQMEKEFGLKHKENIACRYVWTCDMEEEIPEDRIIQVETCELYDMNWQDWSISEDMIEAYLD